MKDKQVEIIKVGVTIIWKKSRKNARPLPSSEHCRITVVLHCAGIILTTNKLRYISASLHLICSLSRWCWCDDVMAVSFRSSAYRRLSCSSTSLITSTIPTTCWTSRPRRARSSQWSPLSSSAVSGTDTRRRSKSYRTQPGRFANCKEILFFQTVVNTVPSYKEVEAFSLVYQGYIETKITINHQEGGVHI